MSEDMLSVLDDLRDHTTSPFLEGVYIWAYEEIVRLTTELKKALEGSQGVVVCCNNCAVSEERVKNLRRLMSEITDVAVYRSSCYSVEKLDLIRTIEKMKTIAKKGSEI